MIWLVIIVLIICSFFGWLLFSPLILEIDSRIASARLQWKNIGSAMIFFDEEWWVTFHFPFYQRKFRFSEIGGSHKNPTLKEPLVHEAKSVKTKKRIPLLKILRSIRTFRLVEWKLFIDTGDYPLNARLYPLNYMPGCIHHLKINFTEENFLYLKIENTPWKMLYAFIR